MWWSVPLDCEHSLHVGSIIRFHFARLDGVARESVIHLLAHAIMPLGTEYITAFQVISWSSASNNFRKSPCTASSDVLSLVSDLILSRITRFAWLFILFTLFWWAVLMCVSRSFFWTDLNSQDWHLNSLMLLWIGFRGDGVCASFRWSLRSFCDLDIKPHWRHSNSLIFW